MIYYLTLAGFGVGEESQCGLFISIEIQTVSKLRWNCPAGFSRSNIRIIDQKAILIESDTDVFSQLVPQCAALIEHNVHEASIFSEIEVFKGISAAVIPEVKRLRRKRADDWMKANCSDYGRYSGFGGRPYYHIVNQMRSDELKQIIDCKNLIT